MYHLLKLFLFLLSVTCSYASFTDKPTIPEVAQREYIHTDSNEFPYIQTFGVYTCVAMVVHNGDSRATLVHFDGGTRVDQGVSWALRDFSDLGNLKISLYGGQPPFKLETQIIDALNTHGVAPAYIERNKTKNESKNITVDVATGEIHHYFETISSTPWQISSEKVNRLKFGRSLYRHEDSIGGGDIVDVLDTQEFNFLMPF